MKEFQEDAVLEQTELAKRLGKLAEFIRGDVFKSLDFAEQIRLQMQQHAMFLYLHFLAERIHHFGKEDAGGTPATTEAAVEWLGELLAVIHGDGGHYQSEHGTEKATKDAISKHIAAVSALREDS